MSKPLTALPQVCVYPITLQPGELLQDFPINVKALLSAGETVASAQVDETETVTAATGSQQQVLLDVVGPPNGEQVPVKVTVHGSLGSIRYLSLLVTGFDPYSELVLSAPNIYLRWRGGYQPATAYAPYDLVLYGGIVYLALQGSTGLNPDNHVTAWMAWAGTGGGGGGGGSGLLPDAGGSGRYAALRTTWIGPGDDDWQVEVVGVQ